MVLDGAVRAAWLCVLALGCLCVLAPCKARIYTNHWAVRIPDGEEMAEQIARRYGYRNLGQVRGHLLTHSHIITFYSSSAHYWVFCAFFLCVFLFTSRLRTRTGSCLFVFLCVFVVSFLLPTAPQVASE